MTLQKPAGSQTAQTAQAVGAACTVGLGWGVILAVTDAVVICLVLSLLNPGAHRGMSSLLLVLLVLMPVVGALYASGYRPAGRAEVRREVGRRADLRTPGTLTLLERGLLDRRLAIAIAVGLPAVVMVVLASQLGLKTPVTVGIVLVGWVINTIIVSRLV